MKTNKNSLLPLCLESLESRCLLSADWAGTWQFTGIEFNADTDSQGAFLESQPSEFSFQLTAKDQNLYTLSLPGKTYTLHDDGTDLVGEFTYTNPDYRQLNIQLLSVTEDIILFITADGGYNNPGMTQIGYSGSTVGYAVREDFFTTNRPWTGNYDILDVQITADTSYGAKPGVVTLVQERQVRIEPDGEKYALFAISTPDAKSFFTETNGDLFRHETFTESSENAWVEQLEWIIPGPVDTLFVIGAEAAYNSPQQNELWWAVHWGGSLWPQENSVYLPDLILDIPAGDPLTESVGQSLEIPLDITNTGNAPINQSADIDLYASLDGNLSDDDIYLGTVGDEQLNLLPGQTKEILIDQDLPDELDFGSYTLIIEIDPDDAVWEIDETNNLAGAPQTALPPEVDLGVEIDSGAIPLVTVPGDTFKIPLWITNHADTPVEGLVAIDLYSSLDALLDDQDAYITTLEKDVYIEPGQSLSVFAKLTVQPDTLPGMEYFIAEILPSDQAIDINPSNDMSVSAAPVEVAWRFGSFGGRTRLKLQLTDPVSTDIVTYSLTGAGWADVLLSGDGNPQIFVYGTSTNSILTLKSKGETLLDGIYPVQNYSSDLKQLTASKTNLLNTIDVNSIRTLKLNNILDGAEILTHYTAPGGTSVKVNHIGDDVLFDLAGALKSFQAQSWTGGELHADSITSLKISHGGLNADVFAWQGGIKSLAVQGDILSRILARGDIGSVKSSKAGLLDGSLIRSDSAIGKISMKYISGATISAAGPIKSVKSAADPVNSQILPNDPAPASTYWP